MIWVSRTEPDFRGHLWFCFVQNGHNDPKNKIINVFSFFAWNELKWKFLWYNIFFYKLKQGKILVFEL